MNEKLLKEYVERVGIVTDQQLTQQLGLSQQDWREPAARLVKAREFFVCRLDHGAVTFVSRHLVFCLRAVYTEPLLSCEAQELYDWLYDNELVAKRHMGRLAGMEPDAFEDAFQELQQKLCIAPLVARLSTGGGDGLDPYYDFLWVTYEYWLRGLHRPTRYSDLAYCLSEIKRLMGPRFTPNELNLLIYHGEL